MATIIGTSKNAVMPSSVVSTVITPIPDSTPMCIPDTFPIALDTQQTALVLKEINALDFLSMPQQDISVLWQDVEIKFNNVLNDFLDRMDQMGNPKLVKMLQTLTTSVQNEKLDEVAQRIINDDPGFLEHVKSSFSKLLTNAKGSASSKEQFWEDTKNLLKIKSSKIRDIVNNMEKELLTEINTLTNTVQFMDDATAMYYDYFKQYVIAVACINTFYEKAKKQVEQRTLELDFNNLIHQNESAALNDKLQTLQSRALAMEGTLTSLPADDIVIRQLKNACILARQDAMTTLPARFAKIKMTLIKLNNALVLHNMQSITDQHKQLDDALTGITSKLTKEVVSKAVNAAGENRKQQAEQILAIVAETKELSIIAEQGRQNNVKNFKEAKDMFNQARSTMMQINQRPH